jgi:hypothetical protein
MIVKSGKKGRLIACAQHESFARDLKAQPGSARSFGIMVAAVLTGLGLVNLWHHGRAWFWLWGIGGLVLSMAYLSPMVLKPFNWVWFKFGTLLHAVVSPIVLALLYYFAVWPTGLLVRAMGKDPLQLKLEGNRDSYWITRRPPGPATETMKDQF